MRVRGREKTQCILALIRKSEIGNSAIVAGDGGVRWAVEGLYYTFSICMCVHVCVFDEFETVCKNMLFCSVGDFY